MTTTLSRRSALRRLAGSTLGLTAAASLAGPLQAADSAGPQLKGRINHSVCKWCYGKLSLDQMCQAAKDIGIKSVELLNISDFPTLKKYDLVCAMVSGCPGGIGEGLNRLENHDKIAAWMETALPQIADAGHPSVIVMSGNRKGLDDQKGIENCAVGVKKFIALAEKYKVNVIMELLNSKKDHADYQCDHTAWGAEVCKRVGSERFKLLYDIYHMQIMEGDLIATIKKYAPCIGHYHTGGVPGRNEIDDTQEIYYPAVMRAIVETGFKGYVAQEFIPKSRDAVASLRKAVEICDV